MQDRFEKEVQHKMEELKLTPSAPVWEKIELEIRPEKKRRRAILWFLLAGLFLSGSAWWLYQSFGNNDRQLISKPMEKPNPPSVGAGTKLLFTMPPVLVPVPLPIE